MDKDTTSATEKQPSKSLLQQSGLQHLRKEALNLAMRFVNAHNNVNKDKWDLAVVLNAAEIFFQYMEGNVTITLPKAETTEEEIPNKTSVQKPIDVVSPKPPQKVKEKNE